VRVILDTNVFISGVFFSGPPFEILNAWRDGRLQLVVSAEILEEYRRVGERLAHAYPTINIAPFLLLAALHGHVVLAPALSVPVCDDPSDDIFFACAIAAGCLTIISGDKHLHRANGYRGIEVHRPRTFVDRFLAS
jgi:uncharacterized protein